MVKWITNRVTEEYAAQGLALGLSADTLARIERCARFIGPRTLLSNGEVYNQIWTYALHRAKQGEPPLSDEVDSFVAGVVHWMHYGVMQPEIPQHFAQVRDAYTAFLAEP